MKIRIKSPPRNRSHLCLNHWFGLMAFVLTMFLLPNLSRAATYYVDPVGCPACTGPVTFHTIALAMAAASNGDTIILLSNDTEQITTAKAVAIEGASQSVVWSFGGTLMNFSATQGPLTVVNLTLNDTANSGSIFAEQNNSMTINFTQDILESTGGTSGWYIQDNNNYTLYLNRTEILGNANSSGGVDEQNGSGTNFYVTNSIITGFTKSGAYGIYDGNGSSVILSSTIADNDTGYYQQNGSSAAVTDTAFDNITADYGGTSFASGASYNAFGKSAVIGTHSISITNAAFTAFGSNYYPVAGSPLIDVGTNDGVAVDYAGTSRPQGAGYDIGAYEYIPVVATNTPTNSPTITYTPIITNTPTITFTFTQTNTPNSFTPTNTWTITQTPTYTFSSTNTPTWTITQTPTFTNSSTNTTTWTITNTQTITNTPTITPTPMPTSTPNGSGIIYGTCPSSQPNSYAQQELLVAEGAGLDEVTAESVGMGTQPITVTLPPGAAPVTAFLYVEYNDNNHVAANPVAVSFNGNSTGVGTVDGAPVSYFNLSQNNTFYNIRYNINPTWLTMGGAGGAVPFTP